MVAASAPAEVDRRHRRQQRRAGSSGRNSVTASMLSTRSSPTPTPTLRCTTRPEPMLPFGIMFTLGYHSRPKAVAHARQRDLGQPHGTPQHRPHDRRHLSDLSPVLPRERAELEPSSRARASARPRCCMPKWSQSRFWPTIVEHGVTHISVMPFVMGALGSPDRPAEHTLRVGVFGLIMPDLDRMFGIAVYAAYGMTETVTHCITGKPQEQLPIRSMGHVTPGYEIAVVDKETGELCTDGETGELWMRGTRGIQLFLEYYDNDGGQREGVRGRLVQDRRHGEDGRGRQRLLPGARQGPAQGRRRERLGQGGRGPDRRPPRGAGRRRRRQEPRVPRRGGRGVRDHGARRPRRRRRGRRDHRHAARRTSPSFKVPRAVYFVDEFPTGTLDKILKNKLREMADERPPVE